MKVPGWHPWTGRQQVLNRPKRAACTKTPAATTPAFLCVWQNIHVNMTSLLPVFALI
jgi:hypothetical protein